MKTNQGTSVTNALITALPLLIFWVVCCVALFAFGDREISLFVHALPGPDLSNWLFWLSQGSGGLTLVSICILVFARKKPKEILLVIVVSYVVWYACLLIHTFAFGNWHDPSGLFTSMQTRPVIYNKQPRINFPATDAAVTTALYVLIALEIISKRYVLVCLAVCAVVLMVARIVIGWSYTADVLSGSLMGAATSWTGRRLFKNYVFFWFDKKSGWWQDIIVATIRAGAICLMLIDFHVF